ncbi:Uma2 family endonuclease [Gloeobacter violaceus]|uniref:Glr3392 protein n=1 Tax=Gloeobacter violaceus (strain ATCC 29082 / PCC 7421) TaxID=251221 RepID=Q7NFY2_GLOVI|nr:Uma2 family endonuclease [Gloeobacter violaceus]BAC91333.1 glr3392 [Gloeobacter violaceus PCC 7421]
MGRDLLEPVSDASEQRIVLAGVSWKEYEILGATLGHRPGLRMIYLEGVLEIITTSREHEALKKIIARLLEVYALQRDIPLFSCGSPTYRREAAARGLEPDESYCLGQRREFPDLAIEVVITSGGIDKLEVYRGLGVQEVWFWQEGRFSLHGLEQGRYVTLSGSRLLADLDLAMLARFVNPDNEPRAVKAFRDTLREVR